MLRCKVFDYERKTAVNIQSEIESIMNQFNIPSGDTSITTDAGANIVAALREVSRYQCIAHRLSSVLTDAWQNSISNDSTLEEFDKAIKDVSGFIHRSDISPDDLPTTLKSTV
ncbi:Hermes transposase [Oopsacas minuta]|uniref:Hermes transposase n=1 Tax=Oopsacas minuta TaxID=111878 RepID=A0AAV7KFP6_9METZ|nr:Hermes transposase [Oopsacas minuta]